MIAMRLHLPRLGFMDVDFGHEVWSQVLRKPVNGALQGHLKDAPRLICFNLGYLPWGNKDLCTKPETTVAAVESALSCLAEGGILSVMSYIGHKGRDPLYTSELISIKTWCH